MAKGKWNTVERRAGSYGKGIILSGGIEVV